jgi:Protein of unknown function (DUF3102)
VNTTTFTSRPKTVTPEKRKAPSCANQQQPTLDDIMQASEAPNIHDIPFGDRFKVTGADVEEPVQGRSNWSEHQMIHDINLAFRDADKAAGQVKSHRIQAGKLLIEASKHVPAGEWGRWCKANVKRSERDIRKVMKIAVADDPEAALREERKRNADDRSKRKEEPRAEPTGHRDRKVNNADQSASSASASGDKDKEIASLLAERAKLEEEIKRLADSFMERTEEWMTLKKEKEAWERSMARPRGELFMARKSSRHGAASFTKEEWMVLIKCLHPDGNPSQELKTQATQLLNVRKAMLVKSSFTSEAEDRAREQHMRKRERKAA